MAAALRLALAASAVVATAAVVVPAAAEQPSGESKAKAWFVRAGAPTGGDGSRGQPFNRLRRVERASRAGDRIIVLPARGTLDGGIKLKRGQRLIGAGPPARRAGARAARVTNTSGARHHGDAVVLADGAKVANLTIAGPHRGGVYGRNVGDVVVRGNDLFGHNTSCAPGFHIPPFNVPTTVPGAGIPISDGLHNGWAAIMLDADRGRGAVTVSGNRVHDAECGDGIDLRIEGRARYRAEIERNVVRDLRQGQDFESLLAIGLGTRDRARLRARLDRNRQTDLGNPGEPEALFGPLGTDTEGVFVNPADASRMRVTIARNTYTNPQGLGGFSGNGMEYVTMGDGSRSRVVIRDSSFSEASGDVLEQLGLGTNARMSLRLVRVVATRSLGLADSGFGNTVLIPGNNADCLLAASGGAGNVIETTVIESELTECANNGLTFGSAVANGSGPTSALMLRVADSRITGNRGANLRVGNLTELERLEVEVERTDLSDSRGTGSGAANVALEELGATGRSVIDLGGGALGSAGGNCIEGGQLAADLIRYDAVAEGNWWGPLGPVPGRVLTAGASLDADPRLQTRPASCR